MKNENSKRAMVGLDLSKMDEVLLGYLSEALKFLELEKVYFVHVVRRAELSDDLLERLKDMDLKGLIGKRLSQVIDSHFSSELESELLVAESDSVASQMNEWTQMHKIGLAIFGKKNIYMGSAAVTSNILRVVKCDQLFVPETAHPELEHILASIDFSAHSLPVLKRAGIFRKRTGAKIQAMHVFRLPNHLFPYVPEKEMSDEALKESQSKIGEYLKKANLNDVEKLSIPARNQGVVDNIVNEAQVRKSDLLIAGARGKSAITSLLIGSITQGLFEADLNMPLLVIKV